MTVNLDKIFSARLVVLLDWMMRLKTSNELVKLVPRILFDGWTKKDYLELFSDSANIASLGKTMAQLMKVGSYTVGCVFMAHCASLFLYSLTILMVQC